MIVDYERIAAEYACHRKVHPEVLGQLIDSASLTSDSQVLEVGCGTGNYISAVAAATGCRGHGIEPSARMLEAARNQTAGGEFRIGTAEHLDYPDGMFDLVFSVDVIHHVQDHLAYYQEAGRVLRSGGLVCTVTDSEEIIRHRQPLAVYFPETIEVDLSRYPSTAALRRWHERAGLRELREVVVECPVQITDIAPWRDKAYSCLHLISAEAHRRGIQQMEVELQEGPLAGNARYYLLWGRKI